MSGRTVPAALGTVAIFAIVVTAVYLLFGGGGGPASTLNDDGDPVVVPYLAPPLASPSDPLPLERIRVSTSSTAADSGPALLVDGDPFTVWESGPSGTDPSTNETLVFRFTEPAVIDAVRFTTGRDSTDADYLANHRIKSVRVTTDTDSQVVNLLDTGAEQEIEHVFGHTSKVVLEVLEVYPSESSDDAGVALAEIAFIARVPS